ncbi:MAG: glutamate synthase [Myxococcota bacterium]
MELVPQSLANLLRRAQAEQKRQEAIFDLPLSKMWKGSSPDLDLSRRFHGERASTPVGPAAGPHTQLAQNIALSYLAGGRVMELKTVQIMDELKIPRPCIDATNIGFNVEWSQELKIHESQTEYAKAALLLAGLKRLGLPEGLDQARDGEVLFDLSLGYDLKGIQSERIRGFIAGMLDAGSSIDRQLAELPKDLSAFRDLSPPRRLVSCVTLSTFHGCPADEIELIAQHLMETYRLHMVVKLNPTLLGFERVNEILHQRLGYTDLTLERGAFDKDLKWDQAIGMIGRLRGVAQKMGVRFGVKLTNTMIVNNHKRFFSDKEMYMSGQPLHVLATQLLSKLRSTVPLFGPNGEPPIMYSFSAGIDQHNFAKAVAADLCPITVCTDLLRPGGYARLPKYMVELESKLREHKTSSVESYVLAVANPRLAMEPVISALESRGILKSEADKAALRTAAAKLEESPDGRLSGLSPALEEAAWPLLVHQAGTMNAARLAEENLSDPRYAFAKNSKAPKKVGSKLALFDCLSCDKCIPVCPNDANFAYEVVPAAREAPRWQLAGAELVEAETLRLPIEQAHQLATFVDACNACGNCDVFCPEDGGPYNMKPHWFSGRAAFEAGAALDGFYLEDPRTIVGRVEGAWMKLSVDGSRAVFEDAAVELALTLSGAGPKLDRVSKKTGAPEGHQVRGDRILVMAALLEGVQKTVNPVSAAFGAP